MNVLHATGTFLPVKGGCPYFVHYLTKHLDARGDDCRVVTTGRGTDAGPDTVETVRARSKTVAGFPVAPTYPLVLHRAIEAHRPDVVHAHYPLPFFPEIAAVLSRFRDTSLVLTCHGVFEMNWNSAIGAFGSVYNRSLLHGSLSAADRIHVSNRGILVEHALFDRYRSKVETVPMGVDTEWFDPEVVDGDPPFPSDRPTVLFVGTFRRYKGLIDLVASFEAVRERVDPQLVLMGDGPMRGDVEREIADRGLGNAVTVTGHVDDETLRRAYAAADVFVLPSPTIAESFGLVGLEAMAMGVPVVATSGSGLGHVLADSAAGTVVSPNAPDELADAIVELLTDGERRRAERTAGRELVDDRFAWDALVDDYRQLYREVT